MKIKMKTYIYLISLLLIAGCKSIPNKENSLSQELRQLGTQASSGDLSAIDKIEEQRKLLYEGIDYKKEQERARSNLRLMRSAFDMLGEAAGGGSTEAMQALEYAMQHPTLEGFAAHSYGLAAAKGNEAALNKLLNYRRNGILLSTAVFSLQESAKNNNQQSVMFLVRVLEDPRHRGLWGAAEDGLRVAADKGNQNAIEALDKHFELN
jgi:hypothetical protein